MKKNLFSMESDAMIGKTCHFLFLTAFLITINYSVTLSFGQNKVQYTNFSWKMLRTPHFYLHFHQDQGNLPDISFYLIENAYKTLSQKFQYTPKNRIPLILYGDPNLFVQNNVISEILPEGVGGFTEVFKSRIVVPFDGSYAELTHVLHHELVHAFCYSIFSDQFGRNFLLNSGNQLPLWFMEGLAEYLSCRWDIEADMFLMDQTINGAIPLPGEGLDGYMAYKGGQSFLFYLASSRGDSTFSDFLNEFKHSRSVESCIKKVYGKDLEELGNDWIQELKRNYWPEIGRRELPTTNSVAITSHKKSKSNYNLRPRISPDGTKIAFFSDYADYSSIVVTDLKGKVLNRISQNGYGGYFETFHPFRSGLSWSPDGKKICFVTKSKGNDEIRIVDIITKKLYKKINTSLTSICSPDWSHDGNNLVFTGVAKGRSDIYLYDLASSSLKRITDNVQFESDPRFTPDSKSIIFSIQDTCGNTSVKKAPYGNTPSDLVKLDLSSLQQNYLTKTPWNEKQPCISPDGKKCAFISDKNGIDNIYIGPIDSIEKAKPITDYIGSCSNPDWSADGKTIVYTMFQQYAWDVWSMNEPESKVKKDTLAYTRWVETSLDTSKRLFTKVQPQKKDSTKNSHDLHISKSSDTTKSISKKKVNESDIYEDTSAMAHPVKSLTLQDSVTRKPDSTHKSSIDTIETDSMKLSTSKKKDSLATRIDTLLKIPSPEPYRLKFTPDMAAVGLGIDNYYGYAGQWTLSFSDLLGDHRITLAGDIQGNFEDYIHLFGSYYYLKHRLDIGVGGYYSKDYTYASVFGDLLYHDQDYGGFVVAEYPFSLYSRVDFEIYARRLERTPVDTGLETIKTNTLQPSLTFTFDNTLWGITGPINGVRASLTTTVSPPLDFIKDQYISVDADFRMYLHLLKRFVWANRLFVGASKSLNDNASPKKYFLGGNDYWLFYHVDRDKYEQNIDYTANSDFVTPFRGWNYIGLSGSRVALLNSEFRFPFIREISVVWPLPMRIQYISGALFTDVGNAWDAGEKHNGIPLPDKLYGGFGFGLRANLGIFILRYDRGWPTDWKNFVNAPTNYFSLGAEF